MSNDPNKSVQDFLDKNGFPFEMKVAGEFQKAGFSISQSVYYADPQTDKPRELDVIARWSKLVENKINFNIVFLIECKYAKTPWIVFSSITKGFPMGYFHNKNGRKWINQLGKSPDFENFFEYSQKYSYGVTVVTNESDVAKEPKDNAYAALQTLLSFLKSEINTPSYSNDYTLFVPIIAIRGKLFEAYLNSDAETQSSEIKEAQVFYNHNINGITPKIHIVTETHLPVYIKKLTDDCERIFKSPYWDKSIYTPSQLYGNVPIKSRDTNTY